MLRFLLWRALGAFAAVCGVLIGVSVLLWFAQGGLGAALRGAHGAHAAGAVSLAFLSTLGSRVRGIFASDVVGGISLAAAMLLATVTVIGGGLVSRALARRRRRYVRLRVCAYRGDRAFAIPSSAPRPLE